METQRPLHLIELFRATQSGRDFLLSCCSSSLLRNDFRRSVIWLWSHRKMKVGCWLLPRVILGSKECQIICMPRRVCAGVLAFASPLVYNPLAKVLVRLRHFC